MHGVNDGRDWLDDHMLWNRSKYIGLNHCPISKNRDTMDPAALQARKYKIKDVNDQAMRLPANLVCSQMWCHGGHGNEICISPSTIFATDGKGQSDERASPR